MRTARVLRKAARLVLNQGLARGVYCNIAFELCALGAIRLAEVGSAWGCSQTERVIGCLDGGNVAYFNDRDDTSADDVASLLMSEAEVYE